jgi:antitoxin FitA
MGRHRAICSRRFLLVRADPAFVAPAQSCSATRVRLRPASPASGSCCYHCQHCLHCQHIWADNLSVATIVIRNLDPIVKRRLQVRAALNGRSMEAEARSTLTQSLEETPLAEARRGASKASGVRSGPHNGARRKSSSRRSNSRTVTGLRQGKSTREVAQKIAPGSGLGTKIHNLFAQFGGVELEIPPRTFSTRQLPKFDE